MTNPVSPLVSVIVPVYNVESYLDCCLNSIRSQTHERFEIIVVEDCSTDGSLARLKPHLSDPRLRLIHHDVNSGLAAARNTGIEAATGEYVMFVDSDDVIAPTLVETCVVHADTARADVVVFDHSAFQDGGPLPELGGTIGSESALSVEGVEYFRLPHFAWLKFIRRDLLVSPRLRFPVGYYYEDWPFHWELGFLADRIVHLAFQGVAYRLRDGSITGSSDEKLLHVYGAQQLVAEVAAHYGRGPKIEREVMRKACNSSWFVLRNVDTKLLHKALESWRIYLRENPLPRHRGTLKEKVTMGVSYLPTILAITFLKGIRILLRRRVRGKGLPAPLGGR